MVFDPGKCHYMCFGKKVDDNEALNVDDVNINRNKAEISGIKIDRNLTFSNHIKTVFRKSGQNLKILLRISSNRNMKQKVLLYKLMIPF